MRHPLAVAVFLCLLCAPVAGAAPAPDDIDRGFGSGGYATGDTYNTLGASAMAVGPQGEVRR